MTGQALIQFSQDERDLLKRTIAPGATDDQLALFVQVCGQTGLNPFARQIYAVIRKEYNAETRTREPKLTIQTSIDGYRLLAQRSGEYYGQDGPYWYDTDTKQWVDVWLSDKSPAAAKVGVLRKGFTSYLYAVARFDSYVVRSYNEQTRKYDGAPANLWAKMPEVMIAKVAEALALRRAFPAELSGIYTKEEMEQADVPLPTPNIPRVQVQPAVHVEGEVVEASVSRPQAQQQAKPPSPDELHRQRIKAAIKCAIALSEIEKGATDEETIANFLKFAGDTLDANIAAVGQLTKSRLEQLDKYLDSKDQA